MRNGSTIYGTTSVRRLALGGGGFVTGLDIAGDGTLVARTDTAGAYVRGPSAKQWTQLIRMGVNLTEANGKFNYPKSGGGYDAAISYTNSSCIAVCTMGYIYYTSNGGTSWTQTTKAYNAGYDPNDNYRTGRRRLAIDPSAAGTGVLYFFDPTPTTGGLFYSLNAGTTWTKSASVPAGVGTVSGCIAIDRNASVVSGKTQTVVVYSPGNGIYKSTTGVDGTFSLVASSPTSGLSSMIVYGGNICFADGTQIKRHNGTSWSQVSTQAVYSLALNPLTPAQIVGFGGDGQYIASTDSGVTWTTFSGTQRGRTATDVPWLATTNENYMSHGMAVFDPANAGQLIISEGIGVWKLPSAPLTQGATVTWQSMTLGIEQLVSQQLVVTPNKRVLYACQDRNFFAVDASKVTVYPRTQGAFYGPPNTLTNTAIDHGTGIDYAIDDETWLCGVSFENNVCNISTDGGKTWAASPTLPPAVNSNTADFTKSNSGSVAVGNKNNIVWVPGLGNSSTGYPVYTTNGGTTWSACLFAGVSLAGVSPTIQTHGGYYLQRTVVAADKTVPGTFYLILYGNGAGDASDLAYAGVWKSTDGGANFTRVKSGRINGSNFDMFNGKLKTVPGKTGHLCWCAGDVSVNDVADATDPRLQFSSDGGVTFGVIPGVYEPMDFCFGAPAPGSSYPTLYTAGYSAVNDASSRGIFRSTNFDPANLAGTTFTKIADCFPLGNYDGGIIMAAHPGDIFGRFYLGKGGSGAFIYDYTDTASAT